MVNQSLPIQLHPLHLRPLHRLAIAGVITATAIAVPAAALASGSGSPSASPAGKSGAPQACVLAPHMCSSSACPKGCDVPSQMKFKTSWIYWNPNLSAIALASIFINM